MLTLTFLLLAAAVLVWPDPRANDRLRMLLRVDRPRGSRGRPGRSWRRPEWLAAPPAVVLAVALAGLLGLVVAGVAGLLAGAALAWAGFRYWRSRQRSRQQWQQAADWAAGVRLLVAELRAGAHPAAAAEGAATDSAPEVARMLRSMAATARLGGDVVAALAGASGPTARMARAWALAERHGVALGELLDAVRRDVEHRAAFAREVDAKMAGPRATAAVLAGLPVLGVLLGESAGSAPLGVLTGEALGQGLLVAGACLLCAGIAWTGRLTRTAVQP